MRVGLDCLHMKGMLLTGQSFIIFSYWLSLGRAVSFESSRLKMSKYQKHMINAGDWCIVTTLSDIEEMQIFNGLGRQVMLYYLFKMTISTDL